MNSKNSPGISFHPAGKMGYFNMAFLRPMGEAIIDRLQIQDTEQVLDIAAGTGEPGIIIAGLTPNGKVVGTDLAEDMLA